MKITIFTLGTRGDVQPFAALGEALAENGHEVTLCTAKNFEHFIKSYSIQFHPINADYEEILNSEEGRKIVQVNLFAIKRNLSKLIFPLIENSLNEFYTLAQKSDLIIYRPKTFIDVFVNQLKVKAIRAAVIPAVEETAAFFNPMYSALRLPGFLNKWSYKLNRLSYRFFKNPIEQFCLQNNLPNPVTSKSEVPFIYGISPHLLDQPSDWPSNNHLTGFWFSNKTAQLPLDLSAFIEADKPPLLITFGSIPIKNKIKSLIISAITKTKHRFIIVKGWADWDTTELEDSSRFKIIASAPFQQLFPKVKAVIHHGGIGTTAECLRAGKPMLICPVLYPVGDHFFWGDIAYKKGLAIKPIPLSKLTVQKFRDNIHELTANKDLYKNCETMAEKLNSENGLKQAVSLIERIALQESKIPTPYYHFIH